jgi:acetyltransferase
MNINKLLCAKSLAIVGASEKIGFSADTCKNVLTYNPDLNRVYFVNPNRDFVFNVKCYKSLLDIDDTIDLVVICTPQSTIIPILREAHTKGCGGAVIYAAGYSEVGTDEGIEAELELKKIALELDIAIMGPNCIGFINFVENVYAFACTSTIRDRKGAIGFISQSGQFCLTTLDSPTMKLSYCISVGNSKIVQVEDYLDYLIEDEATRVVALYLEGVNNPSKFINCLRKAAIKRKPIVIMKAGRSARGAELTSSHTGALAGSDKIFDAMFKKFGVIRADDLEDLLATSSLLSTLASIPNGTAIASMCVSGGETGICADMSYLSGIHMPDFEQETKIALKALLPFATPGNPMDATAPPSYDAALLAECLHVIDRDRNTNLILLGMTIQNEINDSSMEIMYEGIRSAKQQGMKKPLFIISFIETTHNWELQVKYEKLGIPILPAPKYAFSALRNMISFVNYKPEEHSLECAIPTKKISKRIGLSELDSKTLLARNGVPVEIGILATSAKEAVEAAERLGYPAVLKIESAEIQHKSDVGGVRLNLHTAEEVVIAFNEIIDNVAVKAAGAKINGVLVQKMLASGKEFIIGVNKDPQFGPMILAGMGGVFVEIFHDVALYPVPINRVEAKKILEELKSFKLLQGYRGSTPNDVDALIDLMVSVSAFAESNKDDLLELDLNPVFVYEAGRGVSIADALIVLGES